MDGETNFNLSGADDAGGGLSRLGYKHKLAHYTTVYPVSERTLKDWNKIGRAVEPHDLPPLDDPPAMRAWYARRKKNRVPDYLVALSAPKKATPVADTNSKPAAAPVQPATTPAVTTAPPQKTASPAVTATGYTASLNRLREAEALAGERYTRLAIDPKTADEAEQARRSWESLTKQLRAYEKDAEDILQKSGQAWVATEVTAALHDIHTPLRDGMLSIYDRLESRLEPLSSADRRRVFREEVRRLFSTLIANKFTAPPAELQAA